MSDRGVPLEIIDDTLSEINEPSSESEYSSSDYDTDGICYFCQVELDFEENEYYDEQADRFYCKRCFEHILEH